MTKVLKNNDLSNLIPAMSGHGQTFEKSRSWLRDYTKIFGFAFH